jgi:hypothetical protein
LYQEQGRTMADENTTEDLWGGSYTADQLSTQLPIRTAQGWSLWLRNNRNQSRRAQYRVPFVRISNGAFYRPADIGAFVEWEKSKQLGTMTLTGRAAEAIKAYGIGTAAGSATGRKFNVVGVNQQVDPVTGAPYVQLITGDPLMVYRLELAQARQVAAELRDAARTTKTVSQSVKK